MIARQISFRPVYAEPVPPTFFTPKPAPALQTADLPLDISARFGRRLRLLRKERHMTQLRMATTFGIDRSFISDLERGRKSVSLMTLEVFALGFKMSLSELFAEI